MPTEEGNPAAPEEEQALREEALVRACQEGDVAASGRLVDRYWEQVFAYAYRLTRHKGAAEELAQETFLRALQGIRRFRPNGRLRSWLLRTTTDLFLDTRRVAPGKGAVLDESGPPSAGSGQRKQLIEALWEALGELSRQEQVVLLLRAVERMEYEEIAEVLHIKKASARWHMYNARRVLRLKLGSKLDLARYQADAAQ